MPRPSSLKRLCLDCLPDDMETVSSLFTTPLVDFPNLEFLKLKYCGTLGLDLLLTCTESLRLRSLHIGETTELERVEELLLSFKGLKELVLEYPHEPSSVKDGIYNHRETLVKLFWRSTIQHHGSEDTSESFILKMWPGNLLMREEMDFSAYPRLLELGVCMYEVEMLDSNFKPPPNLETLYLLLTEIPPTNLLNFPNSAEIRRLSKLLLPSRDGKPPFRYLMTGFRKPFKEWPRVLELHVKDIWNIKEPFCRGRNFAYTELTDAELVRLHPRLSFPTELEAWMPWDTRRKFGVFSNTVRFCPARYS
ncbi:hypothetical protein H072_8714 [Dactylellina haptotyla CBS 200.50]|uniref:F-box domain-containing protein n=1 Tax=Dactylellina haptotyla (strain CBS 200.50) TaxID=1284197 RepID=S8BEA4_DACHA|nr:hypothetical protein H072_8714 [Dactylellina haptotyla CBS 200.50]